MHYKVLGTLEVSAPEPVRFRPKERVILALLLIDRGRIVTTSRIVDELWSLHPPASANNLVQQYVSHIRARLRACSDAEAEALRTRGPGYLLTGDNDVVDVALFESALRAGRTALSEGRYSDAVRLLDDGLRQWRGAPFLDVHPTPSVIAESERLEEQRLQAVEERFDAELALGRHRTLVSELIALAGVHPFRERLHGQLMLALYRCGRQAEALQVYRDTRRTMMAELGAEPGRELRRLERAILNSDAGLAAPAHVTLADHAIVPAQLPFCAGDFEGRTSQVTLGSRLLRGERRADGPGAPPMLKIVGRPGVGKTALAVRIAHRVRKDYPDGQLFADLHGLDARPKDPSDVLASFLRSLGVPAADLPDTLEERHRAFLSRTADRRVLIVLDGCADETQVRPLLPGAAGCGVIVTSRRTLAGLEGACHVAVEPLATHEAIALLTRTAGPRRAPYEAHAAEVARLCGGLPLAIRIVGIRLAVNPSTTPAALADRLRAAPLDELSAGDLDVRAAIARSYDRLDPVARKALRRLALLTTSGLTGWACAVATGESPSVAERALGDLVEEHLLESEPEPGGQVRYVFDPLIHAYALERAHIEDSPAARRSAVSSMLDAWLTHAGRAGTPGRETMTPTS